jgi:hypothetical protein
VLKFAPPIAWDAHVPEAIAIQLLWRINESPINQLPC